VSSNEVVYALDVLEHFYEQAKTQVTEWESVRWQEEALERGWPVIDLDTGRVYGDLHHDDDDEEEPPEEEPADEEPSHDLDDRLTHSCALVENIIYGSSEDTRGDAEEAKVELIGIRDRWPPEERANLDDAIEALSKLYSATLNEDRFSAPLVVVPEVLLDLNDTLLRALAADPELLRAIDPYLFERVIAEVFRKFKMRVELTKRTRDGGVDIFAFEDTQYTRNRYIIECKHYSSDRKVGLEMVQRLYGVKASLQVTKAFLVTSSHFSRDAVKFARQHVWELELKDHGDVVTWLKRFWKG
jgi:HJR/Mrr/RecB family endonuclease